MCRRALDSKRHRYATERPDEIESDPMASMAFHGIYGWTPSWKTEGISRVNARWFSLGAENELTRDGTAEPVSRDQILRRERGQGKMYFPCSADHEQDWQPYPVNPYSAI